MSFFVHEVPEKLWCQVLKWLEDFSEKTEKRANAATLKLYELLDQTGVIEQDLKNTFNAFRNLSHSQFIENVSTTT